MNKGKVVFFCSASYDIDPKYNVIAREVVRAVSEKGYIIVSGGTVKGTMGAIADETTEIGGVHIGVIPRFMKDVVHPGLAEVVWTDTMSERKTRMREGTCASIALPGGVGTLDELVETLTLAKINLYSGKIFAFNFEGFYDQFKVLLDHYVDTGMLDKHSRSLIEFPSTVEELLEKL